MARITVDDCLDQIPNRFQLTLVAAYRARQLHNGAEPLINTQGLRDKTTVLALREIAAGKVAGDHFGWVFFNGFKQIFARFVGGVFCDSNSYPLRL